MKCHLCHSARRIGMWQAGMTPRNPGSGSGNPTGRNRLLGNPSKVAEIQILGWVTGSEEGEGSNMIRQGKWAECPGTKLVFQACLQS